MKQPTREDYELAAKAAGFSTFKVSNDWHDKGAYIVNDNYWQPLDDDGDSRRLQVACGINFWFHDRRVAARKHAEPLGALQPEFFLTFVHNNDKCEAARHAVFWLAVAIGRAMPEQKSAKDVDMESLKRGQENAEKIWTVENIAQVLESAKESK